MSVVLAVKENNTIYLGTDSQVSYGGSKRLITNPNSFKIWRPKGHEHLIIGGVGALRDINILSTVDIWFDEVIVEGAQMTEFNLDFAYVVRELSPMIRSELSRFVEADKTAQSTFLFAYKDKCYEISSCGAVSELAYDGEFTAIGSGGDITKAVYSAIQDLDLPLKEKMIRALAQACEDDLYVSYPIILMDTSDSKKVEVFDGEYLHIDSETAIHFDDLRTHFSDEDEELFEEIEKEFGDANKVEIEDGTKDEIEELLVEESHS